MRTYGRFRSEMKSDALSQASFAVQKYAEEKEIAKHMKQFFDAKSPRGGRQCSSEQSL